MNWLRTSGLRLLLALGLSIALWGYVSYRVNPAQRPEFRARPVTPVGLPPDLVLVDQSGLPQQILPPVTVTLEVDSSVTLTPDKVQPYVDLKGLGPGDHRVPVAANVNAQDVGWRRQPRVVGISPEAITVRLERQTSKTAPIVPQITGQVEFSFRREDPRLTNLQGDPIDAALVRGPESQVNRVDRLRVTADVNGLAAVYKSTRQLEPVSKDGQPIEGVDVDPPAVNLEIPISPSVGVKVVPVDPRIVGQPASGYIVTNVTTDPQLVRLTGDARSLEAIQNVGTENVDISNATGEVRRTVSLLDQELRSRGVSLQANQPMTATVTVQVAPLDRPFSITMPIPVQAANPPDGLLVSLSPQVVPVRLSGSTTRLTALLNALNEQAIAGTVDLNGFRPGTYQLEPTFNLPEGISQTGDRPTVTVTLRAPPTPTAAPTAVPSATPALSPTAAPAEPASPPPPTVETAEAATSTAAPPPPTATP